MAYLPMPQHFESVEEMEEWARKQRPPMTLLLCTVIVGIVAGIILLIWGGPLIWGG